MQIYIINKSPNSARLTMNMCKRMGFSNIIVLADYKILAEHIGNYPSENLIILCENTIYTRDIKLLKTNIHKDICVIITTTINSNYGLELYMHYNNLFYLVSPFCYSSLHGCVGVYLDKISQKTDYFKKN